MARLKLVGGGEGRAQLEVAGEGPDGPVAPPLAGSQGCESGFWKLGRGGDG